MKRFPELELLFAVPNGGQRHVAVAKKLKAEGVKAGVWDLVLPVRRLEYSGLFIEMKVKPNKLTDKQIRFGKLVREQGFKTEIAYNPTAATDALELYLLMK